MLNIKELSKTVIAIAIILFAYWSLHLYFSKDRPPRHEIGYVIEHIPKPGYFNLKVAYADRIEVVRVSNETYCRSKDGEYIKFKPTAFEQIKRVTTYIFGPVFIVAFLIQIIYCCGLFAFYKLFKDDDYNLSIYAHKVLAFTFFLFVMPLILIFIIG